MRNPYPLMRLSGRRVGTLRGTLALDGFALVKPLGQGRFGSCYLVSRDKARYVLKVFNPNDVKRRKEKLAWESSFLKKIDHPAIPKLIKVIDQDGCYGLVMEKMPGQTLEALLEWDYDFRKKEIAAIMVQLITVMAYLSGLNISHRDIKTDNLLWTGQQLSLIDFGSARRVPRFQSRFNPDFWGIGDVFLRLASSCEDITARSNDSAIDQLNLDEAERFVIKRLLYIENPYRDFRVLKEDFEQVWIKKEAEEHRSQSAPCHACGRQAQRNKEGAC